MVIFHATLQQCGQFHPFFYHNSEDLVQLDPNLENYRHRPIRYLITPLKMLHGIISF